MAREHQEFVQGVIETPFGPMEFALTSGTHVSISAGGSSNKVAAIVVNGVPYYTHIHLNLQDNGVWLPRPGDRGAVYMTRTDNGKDATAAAAKKAAGGVADAWSAFIESEPSAQGEAEWRSISNKIMDIEEKAEEARKVYEEIAARHKDLLAREKEYLP